MPVKPDSTYHPPTWLKANHLMDLWAQTRLVGRRPDGTHRLELPDGDFLDLDLYGRGGVTPRAVVIAPGLQGKARSSYVRGMARALTGAGWDVVAMNYRGCSGEPNRLPRSYNGADYPDLGMAVDYAARSYAELALVGFSMGGNIVLKYLAETEGETGPRARISAAVVFSAPCDFAGVVEKWSTGFANRYIYGKLALRKMRKRAEAKAKLGTIGRDVPAAYRRVKNVAEADHFVSAPLNGFASAAEYWTVASSRPGLRSITTPTLIVDARNDGSLSSSCYPVQEAARSRHIVLELPRYGGHVAFVPKGRKRVYWSEKRTLEFLRDPDPPRQAK